MHIVDIVKMHVIGPQSPESFYGDPCQLFNGDSRLLSSPSQSFASVHQADRAKSDGMCRLTLGQLRLLTTRHATTNFRTILVVADEHRIRDLCSGNSPE